MTYQSITACTGRAIIGAFFFISGITKILQVHHYMTIMEQQGLPFVPLLFCITVALETVAGGALAFGKAQCVSALALAVFTLLAALVFHDFWVLEDGGMREMQMQHFMKNMAIMGGLLYIAVIPVKPKKAEEINPASAI